VTSSGRGRINPIVDARRYGDTTLACVNAFDGASGRNAAVDCFLLRSVTAEVLAHTHVADAWLRTMPAGDVARVYLSPGSIAHFEADGWLACRMLRVDPSGGTGRSFAYDAVTPTTCDENPVRVPREQLRGFAARDKAQEGNAVQAPPPPVPPLRLDEHHDHVVPGCFAFPESKRKEEKHEPVKEKLGIERLASGFVKPDWLREGWTLGARIDVSGNSTYASDAPMCLDAEWNEWVGGGLQLSLGAVVGTASGSYSRNGSTCGTLECRNAGGEPDPNGTSYSCGSPHGTHDNETLTAQFAIGGSIPLDTIPAFRPVCGLGFGPKKAPKPTSRAALLTPQAGVSCNLDLMGSGGFAEIHNKASGASSCGSGCEDGRATSFDETRKNAGFTGALEFEFAAGWLLAGVNGRAGVQYDFKYTWGQQDETTCTETTSTTYTCSSQLARAYASGCVGTRYANYCFDYSHVLFRSHSGECPPFEAPSSVTPGTSAGEACVREADEFWTWDTYLAQCETCCNKLPAPSSDIQDPSSFDADCKASCAAAFNP